ARPVLSYWIWVAAGAGVTAVVFLGDGLNRSLTIAARCAQSTKGSCSGCQLEGHAAVDAEDLAGGVVVGVGEEAGGASDVRGLDEAVDDAVLKEAIVLAGGDAGFRHSGLRDSGADDVDADVGGSAVLLG